MASDEESVIGVVGTTELGIETEGKSGELSLEESNLRESFS